LVRISDILTAGSRNLDVLMLLSFGLLADVC